MWGKKVMQTLLEFIFWVKLHALFATDALTFKKELLLPKPIVCLQAFCRLNCFEQTDLYQSILKMKQKFLLSVRVISYGGNSVQPDDDAQDLLSEQAYK